MKTTKVFLREAIVQTINTPTTSEALPELCFKHALIINFHLSMSHYTYYTGQAGTVLPSHQEFVEIRERLHNDYNVLFPRSLAELKAIVVRDISANADDRIDMVRFNQVHGEVDPEIWAALDGLCPRHLEMIPDYSETGDLGGLDQLNTPWPLESVDLSICFSDGPFPLTFRKLHSLTKQYACRFPFALPEPMQGLKHLCIVENDAIYNFLVMYDASPAIKDTLETLVLTCDDEKFDIYDLPHKHFKRAIKSLHSLLSLHLAISYRDRPTRGFFPEEVTEPEDSFFSAEEDGEQLENSFLAADHEDGKSEHNSITSDEGEEEEDSSSSEEAGEPEDEFLTLPPHLPSSLKNFTFLMPLAEYMLEDLNIWIEHAKDPAWLPNLKAVKFSVRDHSGHFGSEYNPELLSQLLQKKDRFLEELSLTKPMVQVVD